MTSQRRSIEYASMPMLSDMRKRVRVVMIIVAVAFVAGFLMSELWRMTEASAPVCESWSWD